MVILPYKDSLLLFSWYLQQFDLDGNRVNQGLTVYGNKGSPDQHAYKQQLREGVHNFSVTFIEVLCERPPGHDWELEPSVTCGDYLFGMLQVSKLGKRQQQKYLLVKNGFWLYSMRPGILLEQACLRWKLSALKEWGTLKGTVEWGGRNMDKKKSKLVGIADDGQKEIRIERTDEFGQILTPKEAFRLLSRKFHGKGPSKMKQEKRMKQYQEELKLKQMKNSDTPSLSAERMREAQAFLFLFFFFSLIVSHAYKVLDAY
ncbi:hypothetical protein EUGRSUZ_L02270 [Eucalyptus grandis]|uniref:Uncharacterized protein n=1 Tax=Eucalyptus grandis TaxID=71139 RepID=A0A058ZR66_EUCGR|nr:hypothetical protein EUGRSUZ_L02270 [Eucalyptus grandis]